MSMFDGLITETILGQVPSKANCYRVGRNGRIIVSPAVREYECSFKQQCTIYRDKGIDRIFSLFVVVYEGSLRYDLDNALKTILDCLQQVHAIKNDRLCVKIVALKSVDRDNPRIKFGIQEHEPRLFPA